MLKLPTAQELEKEWRENERWKGIARPYKAQDVIQMQGSIVEESSLARRLTANLWKLLHAEPYLFSVGVMSGHFAKEVIKAGGRAFYFSGWQIASGRNANRNMYPDQSIYAANSGPLLLEEVYNILRRADQIQHMEGGQNPIPYLETPCIADAEAGFGGINNVANLMAEYIIAGAAGVHLEDQLSSAKKCGHMGGKVVIPTSEAITKLIAARFAADILNVPTVLVARTDALSAGLIANDIDEQDKEFVVRERTTEGYYRFQGGIEAAIARGLAYAPYADMLLCETSTPDLKEAQRFAEAIRAKYPNKLLAYNLSPSFRWKKHLDDTTIARFNRELAAMGYTYQFITLYEFHVMHLAAFTMTRSLVQRGMTAYVEDVQEKEFALEPEGYTAHRHQREVGAGWFDKLAEIVTSGTSSLSALEGSTEEKQFQKP